jgi:hypothetical protein
MCFVVMFFRSVVSFFLDEKECCFFLSFSSSSFFVIVMNSKCMRLYHIYGVLTCFPGILLVFE